MLFVCLQWRVLPLELRHDMCVCVCGLSLPIRALVGGVGFGGMGDGRGFALAGNLTLKGKGHVSIRRVDTLAAKNKSRP